MNDFFYKIGKGHNAPPGPLVEITQDSEIPLLKKNYITEIQEI